MDECLCCAEGEDLEDHISDLESEKSELHTLLLEARDLVARASHLVDSATWDRVAQPWLERTRHIR